MFFEQTIDDKFYLSCILKNMSLRICIYEKLSEKLHL